MSEKSSITLWIEKALTQMSHQQIVDSLRHTGWNDNDILNILKIYGINELPKYVKKRVEFPDIKVVNNSVSVLGKDYRVVFQSTLPRIVLIEDFITMQECTELINKAQPRIYRSTVINTQEDGSVLSDSRTSEGMFFVKEEFETLSNIEKRIEALTNWSLQNQEAMQVLNYGIGAQYVAHNDYFDETQPGTVEILKRGGNRLATLIIYLNDVESGGGTLFPESTIEVKPKACSVVFFAYPTTNSESKTLHAGMPVITGEKWIAVKWIREKSFD